MLLPTLLLLCRQVHCTWMLSLFATTLCFAAIFQCKLVNMLPIMCVTAGIYTMVLISIERVRCVLPTPGRDVPSPGTRSLGIRGTLIALAVVWGMSAVVAVPTAVHFDIGVSDHTDSSNHTLIVCHSTWNTLQRTIYSLFVVAVSYLLPQVVLSVNYGRLAAYLWRQRRAADAARVQPQSSNAGGRTTRQAATSTSRSTVRTIKMLATVAVLFLASWAPYFAIMTIEVIRIFFSRLHTIC